MFRPFALEPSERVYVTATGSSEYGNRNRCGRDVRRKTPGLLPGLWLSPARSQSRNTLHRFVRDLLDTATMTCANLCVLLFTLLTGVVVFAANDGADIVDYAARFFCPRCWTTTSGDEQSMNERLRLEHDVQNGHVGMYLDYMQEAASSSTSQPDPGQQEHVSR